MMFKLTIESDNAAMVDDPRGEVIRIMERLATRMDKGSHGGNVYDTNGNKVGSYELYVPDPVCAFEDCDGMPTAGSDFCVDHKDG